MSTGTAAVLAVSLLMQGGDAVLAGVHQLCIVALTELYSQTIPLQLFMGHSDISTSSKVFISSLLKLIVDMSFKCTYTIHVQLSYGLC